MEREILILVIFFVVFAVLFMYIYCFLTNMKEFGIGLKCIAWENQQITINNIQHNIINYINGYESVQILYNLNEEIGNGCDYI
ncbi:hypothetical protein YN1_6770 [Nanoarchaeota archaeon]